MEIWKDLVLRLKKLTGFRRASKNFSDSLMGFSSDVPILSKSKENKKLMNMYVRSLRTGENGTRFDAHKVQHVLKYQCQL